MSATPGIRLSRPELSPLSLARAVWKHKLLAAGLAAALSAVSVMVVKSLPAIYKAEALILVEPQKVPEKFVSSTVTDDLQERLTTISQEILSTSRLRDIINDLNLYSEERKSRGIQEVIERIRRDIDVKVEKGRVFRIIYQDRDPKVAAEVANRITKLYIDENLKDRETQAEGTTEFIQNQLGEAKNKLDTLEQAVSSYKIQHTGELPEQEVSLSAALSRLQLGLQGNQESATRAQQDKLALESSLTAAESAEAALKRATARRPGASAAVVDGNETVSITPARRQSEVFEAELAQLLQHYTEDHPDVRRIKARIAAARRAESTEAAEDAQNHNQSSPGNRRPQTAVTADPVTAGDLIRMRDRIATLRTQIAGADHALTTYAEDRKRILDETAMYQRRVEQLPVREQEMAALMRDYEISKSNYKSLLDKKIAAEMAGDLERRQKAERFRILDMAKAPDKPFKPNRNMLYLVSIAAGLGLGVLVAVAKEYRSAVLLGEWELPKGTPVLGIISYIRPQPNQSRVTSGGKAPNASAITVSPVVIAVVGCCLAIGAVAGGQA